MAESKPAPRIEAHTMNSASSRILYHVSCYQLATDAETRCEGWLGHRSIPSTAVYTALAPNRFKDFRRE